MPQSWKQPSSLTPDALHKPAKAPHETSAPPLLLLEAQVQDSVLSNYGQGSALFA